MAGTGAIAQFRHAIGGRRRLRFTVRPGAIVIGVTARTVGFVGGGGPGRRRGVGGMAIDARHAGIVIPGEGG